MARSDDHDPVGYVSFGSGPTLAMIYNDLTWNVVRGGTRLTGFERALQDFYDGFVDFPANPGERRLHDLARRTDGKLVMAAARPGDGEDH